MYWVEGGWSKILGYSGSEVFAKYPNKNMPQFEVAHEMRMKFKSLFMSSKDEYDLPLFLNLSKQFLAPGV